MKLSARLILLGISGPVAGLGLFLMIASGASIKLANIANKDLTRLFNQNNRTSLSLVTTITQQDVETINKELLEDSEILAQALKPLSIDSDGRLRWQGQPLGAEDAPRRLNPVLQLPLSLPTETASLFYRDRNNKWRRISETSSNGKNPGGNAAITAANQREVEDLYIAKSGTLVPRNTMLRRGSDWRMTRVTPLQATNLQSANLQSGHIDQRLVLVLSVSDYSARRILSTSSNLFPRDQHRVAFFRRDPNGSPLCTYQAPKPTTCADLLTAMKHSGGFPIVNPMNTAEMSERQVPLIDTSRNSTTAGPTGQGKRSKETLFIATFPYWNWVTVIGVEGEVLQDTLRPMHQSTIEVVVLLVTSSAILVLLCGYAAWRFARSINRQLLQLSKAADAIAGGDRSEPLDYPMDDALGKLVSAFNAMAEAVGDREDSLRAKIRVLEINISEQMLQGQVCSITDQPGFNRLSERARTMRERRQRLERKAEQGEG